MNLAWSMESGVWNSIPNTGFTSKNDITRHVWYSIPIPMSTTECWYWILSKYWMLSLGSQFKKKRLFHKWLLGRFHTFNRTSPSLYINLVIQIQHWGWIPDLRSKNNMHTYLPWKFTANTNLVIQNQYWDWQPGLRSKNRMYTNLPCKFTANTNLVIQNQ